MYKAHHDNLLKPTKNREIIEVEPPLLNTRSISRSINLEKRTIRLPEETTKNSNELENVLKRKL